MSLPEHIKHYLSTPSHTVNTNYHVVAISLGITVYLILIILQPFGINEGTSQKYIYLLGFALITYIGSMVPTAIMHRIYRIDIEEGRFSNGKNILAYMISVATIMVGNFLYFKILSPDTPTVSLLVEAVWQTLIISVLVLGVYLAFENAQLRREIDRIKQINDRLSLSTPSSNPTSSLPGDVETEVSTIASIQAGKNSDTQIITEKLLFIESDKNYCKITTSDGTSVVRSTLTTLENQLKPCGHVIRCHRAFLVNLLSVESILGSASNGYKLKIKNHTAEVPVSRTYIGDVLKYFEA